jgi:hypothetical protein
MFDTNSLSGTCSFQRIYPCQSLVTRFGIQNAEIFLFSKKIVHVKKHNTTVSLIDTDWVEPQQRTMEGTGAGEERGNGSKLSCRRDASCVGFVLFTRHRSQRVSVLLHVPDGTKLPSPATVQSAATVTVLIWLQKIRSDQIKSNQIHSLLIPYY